MYIYIHTHIYIYLFVSLHNWLCDVHYICIIYIYISGLSRFMRHATGNWGLTSWAERGSSMLVSSYNCYDI